MRAWRMDIYPGAHRTGAAYTASNVHLQCRCRDSEIAGATPGATKGARAYRLLLTVCSVQGVEVVEVGGQGRSWCFSGDSFMPSAGRGEDRKALVLRTQTDRGALAQLD